MLEALKSKFSFTQRLLLVVIGINLVGGLVLIFDTVRVETAVVERNRINHFEHTQ